MENVPKKSVRDSNLTSVSDAFSKRVTHLSIVNTWENKALILQGNLDGM
jgi:hypothetical protein